MKRIVLVLVLLLCLFSLSACYTDNDPWPTGDIGASSTSVPAAVPDVQTTPVVTAEPVQQPTAAPTQPPEATAKPGING